MNLSNAPKEPERPSYLPPLQYVHTQQDVLAALASKDNVCFVIDTRDQMAMETDAPSTHGWPMKSVKVEEVYATVKDKWLWPYNPACKYVYVSKINGALYLSDRNKNPLTLDWLKHQ